jgi:AmmeMemoRadiSam system protein A
MKERKAGVDLKFSEAERDVLRRVAKNSIERELLGGPQESVEIPEKLRRPMGAFVCLKTKGELKGCIGYVKPILPLVDTIKQMAIQAAFHDPRFIPLNSREWKDTEIEISVLTPMKKIKDIEEIEVGIHGLYIEKDEYSGLLLPQVAVENRWDRIEFLEYTCYKAGLPKNAWKSKDADIFIFSADVF